MLQILALLIISWLIIWFFEKGNLSVLGLFPTKNNVIYFFILFVISAFCAVSTFLLRICFAKETYVLNNSLETISILTDIWHQLRMVLTEELICRGVLLYILIKKLGAPKAILISSVFFAILHWLNAGVWGNIPQMMVVFAFTFTMGLLLAFAYAKTGSILLPLAIHFGWNLIQNYIFTESNTGNHLFVLAEPPPVVTVSYFIYFTMLLLPKISLLLLNYFILKNIKTIKPQ